MSFNIEKIYDSDAIDAGRNFHVRVFPKINRNFQELHDGILSTFLPLSGGTMSGNLYVPTLSAATYYSGGTLLETIISSLAVAGSVTYVQNGLNTYTGGSVNAPSVNVSGLSIDNIFVSGTSQFNSISATTFYSGSTNLNDLLGQGIQSYNVFILTAGTLFTFSGGINHVSVNKSVGSSTQIVLSSSPNAGDFFSIKDKKGDCFFYPILVSGGTYTIDGDDTVTLKLKNKPSLKILFDGEEYILI